MNAVGQRRVFTHSLTPVDFLNRPTWNGSCTVVCIFLSVKGPRFFTHGLCTMRFEGGVFPRVLISNVAQRIGFGGRPLLLEELGDGQPVRFGWPVDKCCCEALLFYQRRTVHFVVVVSVWFRRHGHQLPRQLIERLIGRCRRNGFAHGPVMLNAR